MPSLTGTSHLALTVRDMEASAEWYQRVFGWTVYARLEGAPAASPRILLLDAKTFFVVGLCQYPDGAAEGFDHRRPGLDHFAFAVADEAALDEWAAHLDTVGVDHSPVRAFGASRFLTFEDPDGIQFELWLQR